VRLTGLFAIATLLALAIQTILPWWFPIRVFMPHLILILAVDLGFRHPSALAALLAFAMGYATDALSGSHVGLNAFTVTLVFLLAYEVSRHLLATNNLAGAITVFFGALINSLGAFALSSDLAALGRPGDPLIWRLALQALITALFAPPVFALLRRGKQMVGLPLRKPRD
jgi:rod shape-determining protein MreD